MFFASCCVPDDGDDDDRDNNGNEWHCDSRGMGLSIQGCCEAIGRSGIRAAEWARYCGATIADGEDDLSPPPPLVPLNIGKIGLQSRRTNVSVPKETDTDHEQISSAESSRERGVSVTEASHLYAPGTKEIESGTQSYGSVADVSKVNSNVAHRVRCWNENGEDE